MMDGQVGSSQHQQLVELHCFDEAADYLYEELWKACADPLMCVPTCGQRVFYFPGVHMDQLDNSTNPEVIDQQQISNLPPKVLCRVVNVQLLAKQETDEAYAQITLIPQPFETGVNTVDPCLHESPRSQFHSFSKVLTTSDTRSNWGLCIPRRDAINCFPALDTTQEKSSQMLIARDIHGSDWCFQHVFRGHPPRHLLLTKGWKAFVKSKELVAGDSFVFIRGENGQMHVGVRRLVYQQSCVGLSRTSRQTKQVLGAVISQAIATQTLFVVNYEARTSQCIISLNKHLQSVASGINLSVYYEGEGYQHRRSEGNDEQMEEVDGTIYPLPQPTTISSEVDWEGLYDILESPDPLELDHEGGTGENDERFNNLGNQDPSPILQHHGEESGMGDIPMAIQEGSLQAMDISSIPSQIPYGGPGRGDEKIPWGGYLVAQRCIPTLNRVISRYPDSLLGFKPWSNAVKPTFLEVLAELVYLLERFTVESLGRSRDEFNTAKQFLWDLKNSGINVNWVETRLVQIDEALEKQSLMQQQKELMLKYEEARSALGKVEEDLGSVNMQLEELSSHNHHPATNKPILEGLL
ncbi:PREDICTED: auxin response factor 11-like isoform X2 [Ipomoea nil]|uniref:auxin response factor 11-like isoform X2 n=1 Tax=Ipomoea nil TaxID=35883 RepID=UPI0009011D5D|nr:PREDICTED: auxin response factor 11-like isoform X2 [Ipomoea nil]